MARILIADDEVTLANLWKTALELEGHDVDVAYDGEDALWKIEKNIYHILILDFSMPKMCGSTVARQAKLHHKLAKIILVSGRFVKSSQNSISICTQGNSEADFMLPKPIEFDALIGCVEQAWSKGVPLSPPWAVYRV